MNVFLRTLLPLTFAALIVGCDSNGDTFTLYRNSVTDENMRIHVASFNASDGESYNRGNCEQAQLLFQAQPGVKTKFWCEKGVFRK
ncbi:MULTISPECIES: hypothetical protein [unclassified Polaromonas]|jgi:hypothetical protein|uniref:hypothetical protein n=1 Tax=unclassified Polaromonas TaxID=2638319 RepID=UPI000BC8E141|nr:MULTISPECIES: hypothetical protein [unclassified Polaromonas]OYY39746.1 MAG: hypothetical protein B7Y60_00800 [Polaromonas sp. 35-63-35]OYZ22491.1 MAG: hypothetical protein B7Y28_00800 [Polaromonas sp. 16-63-31]OYZ81293.1 MAG: hypothetical protein B7Y09_02355 [Polaromonas sp. 24-63-21]OZA52486.1 MAG: hypothetical protein B7X88_00795 [Polaromonas sp. 17-63-33]OZA88654.1 MAG: hypothetical protein B7X65_08830 [Polaromonas sp. 39-63-25]